MDIEEKILKLIKSKKNGILQNEIWKTANIDSSKCSRIVSKLEKDGLISREQDSSKGSKTYIINYKKHHNENNHFIEKSKNIEQCEKELIQRIENVNFIGEIVLSNDEVCRLGDFIKDEISIDIEEGIYRLENYFPACLACFLVWKGILDYKEGDYWSSIDNSIGISDHNIHNRFGDIFFEFIKTKKLMCFEVKDIHKNIIPILFQGMIPNYCLKEYFEDVILPLFEELTYLDVENEIKFKLQIYRQNNNENVNLKEEFNSLDMETYDNHELYELLVAVWDDFEKIKEFEMEVYDTNHLNSQSQKALEDAESIRDTIKKKYPDKFNDLQREKIEADLYRRDKNHYLEEINKITGKVQQTIEKIIELDGKYSSISIPFLRVSEPIKRFLLYGKTYADNFLIESVRMVKLAKEGKNSNLVNEIMIPKRIINKFIDWWQTHYFFRWNEVPGTDSDILRNYLIQNFGFDWIKDAIIVKVDKNIIKVSKESLVLLLKLNDEKNKVILTSDDITIDELNVEIEKGNIKVYESKPILYFDDGEIKVRIPSQHFNYISNGAYFIMNPGKNKKEESLRIYKSNDTSFYTDEFICSVDSPLEKFEFIIKTDTKELIHDLILGINQTHPYMAFDYKSNKLIKENNKCELPGRDVWFVSRDTCNFEPDIHIIEDRQLIGNWNGYIARAIDLKNIEQLFLCDNGNKYKLQIAQSQDFKPQIYGSKLEFATSNGKEIFINEAPIIRIPFSSNELEKYSIQIFPRISELKESKHLLLGELPEILHFKGDFCEIHLSNEKCIGNSMGEYKVRFKNETHNIDLIFDFCVIPWMNLKFYENIYVPTIELIQPVNLDIDYSNGLKFEPQNPAIMTNCNQNTLVIKSDTSEQSINGLLNYNSISIPITIPIPRLTWRFDGLNIEEIKLTLKTAFLLG